MPASIFTLPNPKKGRVATPAATNAMPMMSPTLTPPIVNLLSRVSRSLSDLPGILA